MSDKISEDTKFFLLKFKLPITISYLTGGKVNYIREKVFFKGKDNKEDIIDYLITKVNYENKIDVFEQNCSSNFEREAVSSVGSKINFKEFKGFLGDYDFNLSLNSECKENLKNNSNYLLSTMSLYKLRFSIPKSDIYLRQEVIDDFKKAIKESENLSIEERRKILKAKLDEHGQFIITEYFFGGKIIITNQSHFTGNLESFNKTLNLSINSLFGSDDEKTKKYLERINSLCNISAQGGDLLQVSSNPQKWKESLKPENYDLIECNGVPIYEFFEDEEMKKIIKKEVDIMAIEYNNQLKRKTNLMKFWKDVMKGLENEKLIKNWIDTEQQYSWTYGVTDGGIYQSIDVQKKTFKYDKYFKLFNWRESLVKIDNTMIDNGIIVGFQINLNKDKIGGGYWGKASSNHIITSSEAQFKLSSYFTRGYYWEIIIYYINPDIYNEIRTIEEGH